MEGGKNKVDIDVKLCGGWIDGLRFYVIFFTVFQFNQDDGRMIIEGCIHLRDPVYFWKVSAFCGARTRSPCERLSLDESTVNNSDSDC